ncbi:PKD domain-containing protein [Halorussus amylolyticus]|uniref:PKD domain-containing protein n=1 Tax=Halorussus amylolyticus TaxID=1126242 RepID=UPI00138F526B|nr:PKD domain-containing protein [Halorussus amylolyticus]
MAGPSRVHTDAESGEQTTPTDQTPVSNAEEVETAGESLTGAFDYAPHVPVVGDSVSFEAETSGGDDHRYEWSFGDGATATGARVTHTYDDGGEKDVTLTATDDDGATDGIHRSLTVYRTADIELSEFDREGGDVLLPVSIRDDDTTATPIRGDSLRFGSPVAISMGGGATPVRTAERDDGLRAWFRATDAAMTGSETRMRLAGRAADGVPVVGTADTESVAQW